MSKMFRSPRYNKRLYKRYSSGDSILMATEIFEERKRYKEKKALHSKFDYDEDFSLDDASTGDSCDREGTSGYYTNKTKPNNTKSSNTEQLPAESKKATFFSHLIVMTLFISPFAYYAYDYYPIPAYIVISVIGFLLFSLGIFCTKKIFNYIFNKPNKRIKLELMKTNQLLNMLSKEVNLTNNLMLSQNMHDQITINDLLIENVDKLSSIDLVVKNQKLKNALSAIDNNCLTEMKACV